ncbi:MAG: ATP-binding protein [Rhodobacteraceae bacterium]|nr:ATP-binding protein [Paracoccaceae bacterium]MCP5341337.1 ATP-binding protein [Paracoccaceae bacterium]
MQTELMECEDRRISLSRPSDMRNSTNFHWSFRADLKEVRETLRRVAECFSHQITADESGTLELVLAEVMNNIVEHGFAGLAAGTITVSITREPESLRCQVIDQGRPMPGLKLPDCKIRPVANCIGELAEGGWGWGLIGALTDDLAYRRSAATNYVCFAVPVLAR